jgi:hypothetical protein
VKTPTILQVLLVAVVCTTALAYAQAPPDSIGTVRSVPVNCQGNLSGGTCYALELSCPLVPDYIAYAKIFDPTGQVIGTVVSATGGDGTDLSEDLPYGPVVIQKELAAGYRTVELSYGFPFNSIEEGWQSDANGAGVRAAACRFATILSWVHDNLVDPRTPLCAAGNSAGSQLIGESLAHYGSDDLLSFAELSSGPPFGRVDYACENTQPVTKSPCSNVRSGLGVPPGTSEKFIDPAYPGAWCSDSYTTHSTTHQTQFLDDSVPIPGADLNYPNTFVNFLFGEEDTTSAIRQGLLYQGAITSPNATECLAGVQHVVEASLAGANQVAADMIRYCKLPTKKGSGIKR